MNSDSTTAILSALHWRYATKQFDAARTISSEDWDVIEQSLVLTPSSFGLQPWNFLLVENADIRAALQQKSWNQAQVIEASHFLVIAARTDLTESDIDRWIECLAPVQRRDAESLATMRGMMVGFAAAKTQEERHQWNVRQVYVALGQLMTTAATLGIDTCPMEGIDTAAYDQILNLEGSGYATAVACALGYRAASDKYAAMPKARFEREKVIRRIG